MAKDYYHYKPVSIQGYGIKWDYSEVALELIEHGNNDSSTEETNVTESKTLDVKKENETFSRKISTWLNRSGNNEKSNSNQSDNSTSPPSKNGSPIESMEIINLFYIKCVIFK